MRKIWVTQGKKAAGFIDAANFEAVKRKGDSAIQNWIDGQLEGTSVTVVLVGKDTCYSRWVKYEIEKSKRIGNGLLGIDISKIEDSNENTTERCGGNTSRLPILLMEERRWSLELRGLD